MVSGRSIAPWSESNVTLNVTLADSACSDGWTDPPGRSHPVEKVTLAPNGAGVWSLPYRFGGADLSLSHRRPWRARCPPGRLSRSPDPDVNSRIDHE